NSMQGTQTLPLSMLQQPRQAYTWPDRTDNDLAFLTVRASHFIQNDVLLSASAYLRTLNQNTVASNINDEFDPALAAGPGNPPGFNDRGALEQRTAGAALQLVMSPELGETVHELTLGASLDGAAATFSQERQEAAPTADRGTAGLAPVTARTVETGARLRPTQQLRMSAALYRSVLSDDIQFITSGAATNAGFFQNTGATLRQGLDLAVDGTFDRFRLGAAYSYVRAEYL